MTWYKYRWHGFGPPKIAGNKRFAEERYWPMETSDTVRYFHSPKPHDPYVNDAFFSKYAPSGHAVISNFAGAWTKDSMRQQYREYVRIDQLPGMLVLFKDPQEAQACQAAWASKVLMPRRLAGDTNVPMVRDSFVDEHGAKRFK